MLLMATSPGGRGGRSVLDIALDRFPRMGARIISSFSLPFFQKNFSDSGIQDEVLEQELMLAIQELEQEIK